MAHLAFAEATRETASSFERWRAFVRAYDDSFHHANVRALQMENLLAILGWLVAFTVFVSVGWVLRKAFVKKSGNNKTTTDDARDRWWNDNQR